MWPFKRKQPIETRSMVNAGYTAAVMSARQSYISGASGIGELTATVQGCISLWEGGLSLADVQGTSMLTRLNMAILGKITCTTG